MTDSPYKKILLVADEPGWIFARHCKEIKKRIAKYHIDVAYRKSGIQKLSRDYDLVYVLDPIPINYPPQHKTIMGLRCEFLYQEHPEGPRGLYKNGFPGKCVSIKDKCCIFHVVNRNQYKVFEPIVTDKPLFIAQHGVDEEIFDRKKYDFYINQSPILKISCSGRSSTNKGFHLIQKACSQTKDIVLSAQYGPKKKSKREMPLFYSQADVHVCMSRTEGLNNPIMEAGAMGLPVISTRSGAAEEIIVDGENGLLIDRSPDALKEALDKMRDPEVRHDMGQKMYETIMEKWTWKVKIKEYRKMFDFYFATHD